MNWTKISICLQRIPKNFSQTKKRAGRIFHLALFAEKKRLILRIYYVEKIALAENKPYIFRKQCGECTSINIPTGRNSAKRKEAGLFSIAFRYS